MQTPIINLWEAYTSTTERMSARIEIGNSILVAKYVFLLTTWRHEVKRAGLFLQVSRSFSNLAGPSNQLSTHEV